jgi:hypothetical protein
MADQQEFELAQKRFPANEKALVIGEAHEQLVKLQVQFGDSVGARASIHRPDIFLQQL